MTSPSTTPSPQTASSVVTLTLAFTLALTLCGCPPHATDAEMPPNADPGLAVALAPVPATAFRTSAGTVERLDDETLRVDEGGMRGDVDARTAGAERFAVDGREAATSFVYEGPSTETVPLANGELRRQIGLRLLARDTCNVLYVTWHVAPTSGVHVSLKQTPNASTHAECGATGYQNLRPRSGASLTQPPELRPLEPHTLHARLEGAELRVFADERLVWEGSVPETTAVLHGPAGVRTDNGIFRFSLRAPARLGPSQTAAPESWLARRNGDTPLVPSSATEPR